jgi:hypothetical protein
MGPQANLRRPLMGTAMPMSRCCAVLLGRRRMPAGGGGEEEGVRAGGRTLLDWMALSAEKRVGGDTEKESYGEVGSALWAPGDWAWA